jgi:hypothetical protein
MPEKVSQELQRQKSGDEGKLEISLAAPLVKHAPVEEIKQVLRLIMVKIGLRAQNWPEEEEKDVLIDHIISNYGGHTVEEIRLAFEMAIGGKLDLPLKDVKCYENFSCAYFSSIMNSYRKWSEEAYRLVIKDTAIEQRIFTDEELDDSAREDAERQYQIFLRGNEVRHSEVNRKILEKDGLIENGETVMDFFKRKAISLAVNIYKKIV